MFRLNEVIRAGNSTARVKNYYPDTGLLVLMDIRGTIESGMTIIGDDSGETEILNNFIINDDYDLYYEPTGWSEIDYVVLDSGEVVAIDEHFTGDPSQDYQTEDIVVL